MAGGLSLLVGITDLIKKGLRNVVMNLAADTTSGVGITDLIKKGLRKVVGR